MDFSQFQAGLHKTKNLTVMQLIFQEMGTYNQQYARPYWTDVKHDAMQVLVDRFSADPGKILVSPTEIADVASRIMVPQTDPERAVEIPNNWGSTRMRFTLYVEAEYISGGTTGFFIFGYTDVPGVSLQTGAVAPDMMFFVNSVIQTRQSFRRTANGMAPMWSPVASDHIHGAPHSNQEFYQRPDRQYLLRPVDVFNTNQIQPALQEANFGPGGPVFDSRNTLTGVALSSRRENSLPAHFAANVIQAQLRGLAVASNSSMKSDRIGTAAGFVQENPVQINAFLAAISSIRGDSRTGNCFVFRDLCDLDPTTPQKMKTILNNDPSTMPSYAGSTSFWHGGDLPTITATALAHGIPAIMMALGITHVAFTSTNNVIGSMISTTVGGAYSITQQPLEPLVAAFISRLDSELLMAVTHGNALGFHLSCEVDIFGETKIYLHQFGSDFNQDFVVPTFCDGLFAPTVTQDNQRVMKLAQDFGEIVAGVQQSAGIADASTFQSVSF